MTEILVDAVADGLLDTLKVIPFLFITYLLMELLEHHTQEKTLAAIRRADRLGPLFGGILGVIPQCGFSASAASFYAGRVITAGTMIAVFLSTSDEMLPLMLSANVPFGTLVRILATKAVFGIAAGFAVDFLFRRLNQRKIGSSIHDLCAHDDCSCDEDGIVKSALKHTLNIILFLAITSVLMNIVIGLVGEDALAGLFLNRPVVGELAAGLIGLIPNCAASVVITTLYLQGGMSAGAMMSGLLVGAGVGLLVLFRNSRRMKENIQITLILYVCGVLGGLLVGAMRLRF